MFIKQKESDFITTLYLIRHSVRMPKSRIESYHSSQDRWILDEKIILSTLGEERAKILCSNDELKDIDTVYTSNCVRTLQTAKYLLDEQGLNVNIDDRFDERRTGKRNDDIYPDWFSRQYFDPSFKTEGGESQIDVQKRFSEAITEILEKHKDERIAVFTHGYAITFYLLTFCKLLEVDEQRLKIEFKGNVIFNQAINAPELFKLTMNDDGEVEDIKLIKIKELSYMRGI